MPAPSGRKWKVLLVEDESSIRDSLVLNLELDGYEVFPCVSGGEALGMFQEHKPDLVVLDLMLPVLNGLDVCRQIREVSTVPVFILSAKGKSSDRVAGLKAGADDYLAKPFDLEEFLIRVQKLLERSAAATPVSKVVRIGEVEVDFNSFEVKGRKTDAVLTSKERDLLYLLYQRRGTVVSREEILESVWGSDDPTSRTIDNYVLALRKLVEVYPKKPRFIQSVRGVGYKMVLPDDSTTAPIR